MNKTISSIIRGAIKKRAISKEESFFLVSEKTSLWDMLYGANYIRTYYFKDKIHLCSIVNAKSGNCSEDCNFCAQSSSNAAKIKSYRLLSSEIIKKAYFEAQSNGADGFSIVTSGNRLSKSEIKRISIVGRGITRKKQYPYLCLSVGKLSSGNIQLLKKSGISKIHHNIESSERFFPKICSTHSYTERVENILSLKKAGLKVCSGGIFGMGETWHDRIEVAFALKKMEVDSIPLNFLIPICGTPMADRQLISPMTALRIIALFRFVLPDTDIRVCAGREQALRDLQSYIFYAGATGMMIGGYLTQPGRTIDQDLGMIRDLGLKPKIKKPHLRSG